MLSEAPRKGDVITVLGATVNCRAVEGVTIFHAARLDATVASSPTGPESSPHGRPRRFWTLAVARNEGAALITFEGRVDAYDIALSALEEIDDSEVFPTGRAELFTDEHRFDTMLE